MKFVSCRIATPSSRRTCAAIVTTLQKRSISSQFIFSNYFSKATFSTIKQKMAEQAKKTVLVPIANGTEEIEVNQFDEIESKSPTGSIYHRYLEKSTSGCYSCFSWKTTQRMWWVTWHLKPSQVVCSRGVKIEADALITDCVGRNYDLIVLPGGMPVRYPTLQLPNSKGATNLKENPQLKELLLNQKQQNKFYGAIWYIWCLLFDHQRCTCCCPAKSWTSWWKECNLPSKLCERLSKQR